MELIAEAWNRVSPVLIVVIGIRMIQLFFTMGLYGKDKEKFLACGKHVKRCSILLFICGGIELVLSLV